jgi:amino acid transporter
MAIDATLGNEKGSSTGSQVSVPGPDAKGPSNNVLPLGGAADDTIKGTHVSLKRGLTPRHIQLFSIGGVIGTGLFLGTGSGLAVAGPLSLFLAFILYSSVIWAIAQAVGEISTFIPVGDAYLMWANRFGGRGYACAVSWNYVRPGASE